MTMTLHLHSSMLCQMPVGAGACGAGGGGGPRVLRFASLSSGERPVNIFIYSEIYQWHND